MFRPNVVLLALFCGTLAGCFPVQAVNVQSIQSEKNFSAMSCEQLGAEKARIELELGKVSGHMQHGTRKAIGVLRGEADAVNDRLVIEGCRIPPVKLPAEKKRP